MSKQTGLSDIRRAGSNSIDLLISYWDRVANGEQLLSTEDWAHIDVCSGCQEILLDYLTNRRMKVTTDLMAHLKGELKEKVIRTICLAQISGTAGS